ncbi:beta-1,6-N-acetylglucosaminyltransferase [Halomonas sp. McH1-25]|nr:beta-1,6-N-acetylglucosaminyltransferase [Halomonas sp. McH1-25]MCP1342095.1 beta-1,6-N-acetylglucosaminyltransferase [Halomonas sp. FL8]MCP1360616.1 beta-1,6-N-acetylglucosaminyltransferase [Halomonas sp. BBD45]MCP1366376.1 beta-1,6-N-acetylglucosaminyltransferase [Halomonas sp. BBD48]
MTNPLRFTVSYLSSFESNRIYIHVDGKSDIQPFMEEFRGCNIFFVGDRVNVAWGSVTQVDATLSLLRAAVKEKFDYLFLISGDDIPAVSNDQIVGCLNRLKGHELIAYQDERFSYVDPLERVKYRYPKCCFKKEKNPLEKFKVRLHGLGCRLGLYKNSFYKKLPELYKGTSWFTITYDFSCFVLDYVNNNPEYRRAFQESFCCDEIFFHTILMDSPFRQKVYHNDWAYSDSFRYIDWKSGPDYPRTLDESDFKRIKSSAMLFARKVRQDIDMDALHFFTEKSSELHQETA